MLDADGSDARTIKQRHPEAKIVFVGPCAAKKLEASRRSVRSDVDFVITFEELDAIFTAKGIDMETYDAEEPIHDATGTGRGYAVAGGVANAIENCINEYYPGTGSLSLSMRKDYPTVRKCFLWRRPVKRMAV